MRGMEETVEGMRKVFSKCFLPTYVKYGVQGINVHISKKVHIRVISKTESRVKANLKCKSWGGVLFLGSH